MVWNIFNFCGKLFNFLNFLPSRDLILPYVSHPTSSFQLPPPSRSLRWAGHQLLAPCYASIPKPEVSETVSVTFTAPVRGWFRLPTCHLDIHLELNCDFSRNFEPNQTHCKMRRRLLVDEFHVFSVSGRFGFSWRQKSMNVKRTYTKFSTSRIISGNLSSYFAVPILILEVLRFGFVLLGFSFSGEAFLIFRISVSTLVYIYIFWAARVSRNPKKMKETIFSTYWQEA